MAKAVSLGGGGKSVSLPKSAPIGTRNTAKPKPVGFGLLETLQPPSKNPGKSIGQAIPMGGYKKPAGIASRNTAGTYPKSLSPTPKKPSTGMGSTMKKVSPSQLKNPTAVPGMNTPNEMFPGSGGSKNNG